MRKPVFRAILAPDEIVVDNFAGGGGVSEGLEQVLPDERPVDIAINHDANAIAMHKANHPETKHFQENILEVDPVAACAGRRVALAWFSPDCTHFSRAKGGKPVSEATRALAWTVITWAKAVRPRVICLENVEEFKDWGPLREDNRPDPGRKGETFRAWLAELSALGYSIEFKSLVAADYGAPTTRKRFFLVARADGARIAWPEPTHGPGRPEPWRAAAEIIDWSLPVRSIFGRKKPLADATMARIAEGLRRFVFGAERPFIIPVTHQGDRRVHDIADPLRTVTGANRGEFALVAPTLIQRGWGERKGQRPRAMDIGRPLGTVVAGGSKHALVAAFITKHFGGPNGHKAVGHPMQMSLGTVTARDHHSLTAAYLTKFYGTCRDGAPVDQPMPTITSGGGRGGGHIAAVRAFLVKYYGAAKGQLQLLDDPLHTITTKARFGLVVVDGEPYQIADIGMRMLEPPELFGAQGFPADYDISPIVNGKRLTKTAQTKLAGNAVPPQEAAAVAGANLAVAA